MAQENPSAIAVGLMQDTFKTTLAILWMSISFNVTFKDTVGFFSFLFFFSFRCYTQRYCFVEYITFARACGARIVIKCVKDGNPAQLSFRWRKWTIVPFLLILHRIMNIKKKLMLYHFRILLKKKWTKMNFHKVKLAYYRHQWVNASENELSYEIGALQAPLGMFYVLNSGIINWNGLKVITLTSISA